MENYYVIWSDDGEACISAISKEKLEKRLNEGNWYGVEPVFLPQIPNRRIRIDDLDEEVIIIKGEVVAPKVAHTVVKYTV